MRFGLTDFQNCHIWQGILGFFPPLDGWYRWAIQITTDSFHALQRRPEFKLAKARILRQHREQKETRLCYHHYPIVICVLRVGHAAIILLLAVVYHTCFCISSEMGVSIYVLCVEILSQVIRPLQMIVPIDLEKSWMTFSLRNQVSYFIDFVLFEGLVFSLFCHFYEVRDSHNYFVQIFGNPPFFVIHHLSIKVSAIV